MKNIFIVHGSFGNPQENWIPWLKAQCEEVGYVVTVPTFPSGDEQNYDNWMKVIEPHLPMFDEETILVGHSIGPAFILGVLEKLNKPIKKSILVSGFLGLLGDKKFDAVNETISNREFDFKKIREASGEFVILHGSDDPYVPVGKAEELGLLLNIKPIIVPHGGHLNMDAGFVEFPLLLNHIQNNILLQP